MKDCDACAQFGRRVRSLRLQRGLSQEKLGELAELDRTYISQTETGRRNVTLTTIVKLATALGVDAVELLRAEPDSQE